MKLKFILILLPIFSLPAFAELQIRGCPKPVLTTSANPTVLIQVEYWELEQKAWIVSGLPTAGPQMQVEAGRLYRSRTCSVDGDCSSASDVVWAPLFLCPGDRAGGSLKVRDEIEIKDPQGNLIARGLPGQSRSLEEQFIDYNIIASVRDLNTMDEKVAMQKPAYVKDWLKATLEERLVAYVYLYYEQERLGGAVPDMEGTGFPLQ
jgi:hypothetical protein